MASSAARTVAAALVASALVGAAATVQAVRERTYPPPADTEETLYVSGGPGVRRLAFGYTDLAADLYWMRALQYYGGTKLKLNEPRPASPTDTVPLAYQLLYPYLDVTTTFDPLFNIAYRFGAIFLAEPYPSGAGRPDLAITLLEKGLRAKPDKWEYMQDIGFVHYWWRNDYKAAADWFQRSSELPGAPWWLKSLAATTLAEGGDRQSSRLMWESIRASAEIDWLKRDAERRLVQLRAMDEMDALQKVVDQGAAGGETPTWEGLVRQGLLPGIPVDPSRTRYEIDANRRVTMSPRSPLFPLPLEPQRMVSPLS